MVTGLHKKEGIFWVTFRISNFNIKKWFKHFDQISTDSRR